MPKVVTMKTEEFDFKGFTRVEVGGIFDVEIAPSEGYRVSVTSEEKRYKHVRVAHDGDTLRIRHDVHFWGWFSGMERPKAFVTMPFIQELSLSGASRVRINGFPLLESLRLRLTGVSSLSGEIKAKATEFNLLGAGSVMLRGSANTVTIRASGASRIELADFTMHDADVRLNGASYGTVNLDGTLNARLIGASTLYWVGKPTMGDVKTLGFSSLLRK
jgi:hypothetical protein